MSALSKIPENIKSELKVPLGKTETEPSLIIKRCEGKRVISVGDACTLNLLRMGVRPYLAIFDHRTKREKITLAERGELEKAFPEPLRYDNPAGTLSVQLIADASVILRHGGAVLISGEEDLTALPFILVAQKTDLIIYGQPDVGMVLAVPDEGMKKRVSGWLSVSFGHKV